MLVWNSPQKSVGPNQLWIACIAWKACSIGGRKIALAPQERSTWSRCGRGSSKCFTHRTWKQDKKIEVMKSNEPMWSLCVSLKIESQHENPGSYQSESFISNLDANKPSCWATRSLGFLLGPYVWEPNCRNGGISFLGYYRNLRFFWRNQGIQSICNNTQQFSYQVTQWCFHATHFVSTCTTPK